MVQKLRDGSHPDIDEWGSELKEILKESPGLSLARAVKLAKDENPEKAAKLKEQYDKDREEAEMKAEKERKQKRKQFGGLTPSSSKTERNTRMGKGEAADAAWDEVIADLDDPSILDNTS